MAPSASTAAAVAAGLIAVLALTGCVSTQTKRARTLNVAAHARQRAPLRVTHADPDVDVGAVGLVRTASGDAVVVQLRNPTARPLSDLPISVGLRSPANARPCSTTPPSFDDWDNRARLPRSPPRRFARPGCCPRCAGGRPARDRGRRPRRCRRWPRRRPPPPSPRSRERRTHRLRAGRAAPPLLNPAVLPSTSCPCTRSACARRAHRRRRPRCSGAALTQRRRRELARIPLGRFRRR